MPDIFDDEPRFRLTPEARKEIEARHNNDREAHALLDVIVAEWESDPTSTACFDQRIIERAKTCVRLEKSFFS